MFSKLSQLFATSQQSRQRQKLTKPEYGFLFDAPPTNEWVSLDFEMTGLNPKTDHILSVGAVRLHRAEDASMQIDTGNALSLICRPPVMPSKETIVIHGLRPSDVEDGISYDEMLPLLLEFIGNRPIVGFAVNRDIAFLNALLKPWLGVSLPNPVLDVSVIEQQARQRKQHQTDHAVEPKHLNVLLAEFGIPILPAHDALNDAIMTAMLFIYLKDIH